MIIKGTGNSRLLKSVPDFLTRYPTYEDFVSALVAGTLPFDFNGVNADGIEQMGTAQSKANLLPDDVAEKLELEGDDPTVAQAINELATRAINLAETDAIMREDINSKAQITLGSYKGKGGYGKDNANTLTFSFEPKFVVIQGTGVASLVYGSPGQLFLIRGQTESVNYIYTSGSDKIYITWDGNKVSWYNADSGSLVGSESTQCNKAGATYYYIAIG